VLPDGKVTPAAFRNDHASEQLQRGRAPAGRAVPGWVNAIATTWIGDAPRGHTLDGVAYFPSALIVGSNVSLDGTASALVFLRTPA
jgi:hypothetical protein